MSELFPKAKGPPGEAALAKLLLALRGEGDGASSVELTRLPVTSSKQTPRRSFLPIRASVGANSSADRADHARAERGHGHIVRVGADVQYGLVITPQRAAGDCQQAHTILGMLPRVIGFPHT